MTAALKELSGLRGLYAITPDGLATADLIERVRLAVAGGARIVQYRNKTADAATARAQAAALQAAVRATARPALLVINDDLDLALAIDADGLHLGGTDGDIAAARRALDARGPGKVLGASCYAQLDLAHAAEHAGADYVAFGSVFASGTKPGAVRAPLELFSRAKQSLRVPVCAIGGINAANAAMVVHAGADMIAVIGALFDAPDVRAAAHVLAGTFGA